MRSFADSLADGVLADAISILPRPAIPPTNVRMARGPQKNIETSNRKQFTSK